MVLGGSLHWIFHTEHRLDAIRTLNSFVAALSLHDGDHYEAMDTAFEEVIK